MWSRPPHSIPENARDEHPLPLSGRSDVGAGAPTGNQRSFAAALRASASTAVNGGNQCLLCDGGLAQRSEP